MGGVSYTTSEKEFYGYTLTETPSNANGIYTKEPITVTYVYSKNKGTVENNEVTENEVQETTSIVTYKLDFEHLLSINKSTFFLKSS